MAGLSKKRQRVVITHDFINNSHILQAAKQWLCLLTGVCRDSHRTPHAEVTGVAGQGAHGHPRGSEGLVLGHRHNLVLVHRVYVHDIVGVLRFVGALHVLRGGAAYR